MFKDLVISSNWSCLIQLVSLTRLNVSRSHDLLPKYFSSIGCCTKLVMIGSIFWMSAGNKYHSNWSIISLHSSNANFTRWPSSQLTRKNWTNEWLWTLLSMSLPNYRCDLTVWVKAIESKQKLKNQNHVENRHLILNT